MVNKVNLIVALWDQRDKNYRNRDLRGKLWDEVGKELGIEGDMARKSWELLRDMLRKKIKENCGASGAAAKSKWVYFDSLSFLLPMMKPRATSGNLPASQVANTLMDMESGEINETQESGETLRSQHDFDVHTEDKNVDEPEEITQVNKAPQPITTSSTEESKFRCPGPKKKQSQNIKNEALKLERRKVQLLKSRFSASQPTSSAEEDDDLSFFKSLLLSLKQLPLLKRMKLRSNILNCVIADLESLEQSNTPWTSPLINLPHPPRNYTGYYPNQPYASSSSDTSSSILSPCQPENSEQAEFQNISITLRNLI